MRRACNVFPNEIKRPVVALLSGSVCLLCVKLKSKIFLPTPLQPWWLIIFYYHFFFQFIVISHCNRVEVLWGEIFQIFLKRNSQYLKRKVDQYSISLFFVNIIPYNRFSFAPQFSKGCNCKWKICNSDFAAQKINQQTHFVYINYWLNCSFV